MHSSFELLLSEISEGTLLARREQDAWRLFYANTSASRMLKIGEDEWMGKTPLDILGSYLDPEKRVIFQECLDRREVYLEELYPDAGDPENILSLRSRFVEADGETLWVAILENLAARRRLSRELYFERERAAQVLRRIKEGVILVNEAGEIQLLNRVAEMLTGWKRMEAIGESSAIVVRLLDSVSRERIACPL